MKKVMRPVLNRMRGRKQPEIFEFAVLFDAKNFESRCLGKIKIIDPGKLLINMAARDRVIELLEQGGLDKTDILAQKGGMILDIALYGGATIRIVPLPRFEEFANVVADQLADVRERALPIESAA